MAIISREVEEVEVVEVEEATTLLCLDFNLISLLRLLPQRLCHIQVGEGQRREAGAEMKSSHFFGQQVFFHPIFELSRLY